jgi:acetyltransferase-like isoleucine patch superfamily enzyme
MIVKIRTFIRWLLLQPYFILLTKVYKMNISKTARVSLGAKLDKTYPNGDDSYIASGAIVFTHDFSRTLYKDTIIGKRCFIGANAIIMAGVKIGNEVIIGSGAIVTKDIPSNCVAAGNPAKILKTGIKTSKYGKLINE